MQVPDKLLINWEVFRLIFQLENKDIYERECEIPAFLVEL